MRAYSAIRAEVGITALCLFCLMEPANGRADDVLWEGEVQTLVSNDFESGLPVGWSIIVNGDTNATWRFDDPGAHGNVTGGAGGFAVIDSFDAGYVDADSELRTSPYAVVHTALTYLVFRTDFMRYEFDPEEVADVDVSTNGNTNVWYNIWRQTGASYTGQVRVDMTSLLKGASNFVVRFHYYHSICDWWWQIDDVAIVIEADGNANGLPDWWETQYYGGPTNLALDADGDHDGALDRDEWIAGTDPTNGMSVLRLGPPAQHEGHQEFEFPTCPGRIYTLMTCSDLMSGNWTNASPGIRGAGGVTNFIANEDKRSGFYRVFAQRW